MPTLSGDPDGMAFEALAPFLSLVTDVLGREHAVLSDGWRRIRLDVEAGSLSSGGEVLPLYRLHGIAGIQPQLLPLRRFVHLCRTGRFASSLFRPDPRMPRRLMVLRIHDALAAGATQREIAVALFGAERVRHEWNGDSDSLRMRIRRLARDARAMASGSYRWLLRKP